jgi:hypothetical protein
MSRKRLLLLAVALLMLVGIAAAVLFYRHIGIVVADCYIQERVAHMIVEHMERSGGNWPQSWDDLSEAYELCEGRSGLAWGLQEIRDRCTIDFKAVPTDLANTDVHGDGPPFRVVYLTSGGDHYWSGAEPNRIIYDYLQARAHRPPDYEYPRWPVPAERDARRALLDLGATWRIDNRGHVVFVHMGSPTGSPRFSDNALQYVAKFPELEELILANSDISDAGLKQLESLSKLRSLDLVGTRITDSGLICLSRMNDLELLSLAFCRLSDGAFEHIVTHRSLKSLNLNYTDVSDAGTELLYGMPNLEDVLIGDTNVTEAGANALQQSLPKTRVYHRPRTTTRE